MNQSRARSKGVAYLTVSVERTWGQEQKGQHVRVHRHSFFLCNFSWARLELTDHVRAVGPHVLPRALPSGGQEGGPPSGRRPVQSPVLSLLGFSASFTLFHPVSQITGSPPPELAAFSDARPLGWAAGSRCPVAWGSPSAAQR